jgi:hypothetical protein
MVRAHAKINPQAAAPWPPAPDSFVGTWIGVPRKADPGHFAKVVLTVTRGEEGLHGELKGWIAKEAGGKLSEADKPQLQGSFSGKPNGETFRFKLKKFGFKSLGDGILTFPNGRTDVIDFQWTGGDFSDSSALSNPRADTIRLKRNAPTTSAHGMAGAPAPRGQGIKKSNVASAGKPVGNPPSSVRPPEPHAVQAPPKVVSPFDGSWYCQPCENQDLQVSLQTRSIDMNIWTVAGSSGLSSSGTMLINYHYRDKHLPDFLVEVQFSGPVDTGSTTDLQCWTTDKKSKGKLTLRLSESALHARWWWTGVTQQPSDALYLPGDVKLQRGKLETGPGN